jgi:hypothetical protein
MRWALRSWPAPSRPPSESRPGGAPRGSPRAGYIQTRVPPPGTARRSGIYDKGSSPPRAAMWTPAGSWLGGRGRLLGASPIGWEVLIKLAFTVVSVWYSSPALSSCAGSCGPTSDSSRTPTGTETGIFRLLRYDTGWAGRDGPARGCFTKNGSTVAPCEAVLARSRRNGDRGHVIVR